MKSILVLISNYGSNQIPFCENLISGLNKIKNYKFNIKVFSSQKNNFEFCEEFIVTDFTGNDFTLSIYHFLKNFKEINSYDYILLTENDLFFTQENFDTFFELEEKILNDEYTIGFLRYEIKNDKKYLIDFHYDFSISLQKNYGILEIIDDKKLILPKNPHQGFWFLKPEMFQTLLKKINIGVSLEDKVSKVYYSTNGIGSIDGIKKYIPLNNVQDLLVHHQPNKYVNIFTEILELDDLKKEIQNF